MSRKSILSCFLSVYMISAACVLVQAQQIKDGSVSLPDGIRLHYRQVGVGRQKLVVPDGLWLQDADEDVNFFLVQVELWKKGPT